MERPGSAFKELLENALDSGAGRIVASVEGGGIAVIRVSDDGCGIAPDELELAVAAHATSKIRSFADLEEVASMGFRGEALASIAVLAGLRLRSRVAEEKEGRELVVGPEEGAPVLRQVPMAAGTEALVTDLFARVPARRRFLRKPSTEWAHCENVWMSFALSCPQVALELHRDGKQRKKFPAQDRAERVGAVLGGRFTEDSAHIVHEAGPLRAEVFINPGQSAASSRAHLFLNGRALRDRLLRQAVRKGAADCSREAEPAFAIFLEFPGRMADVNVHPAKTEVRFYEPQAVYKFVYNAVSSAFAVPAARNPRITLPPQRRSSGADSFADIVARVRPPAPALPEKSAAATKAGRAAEHAARPVISPQPAPELLADIQQLGEPLGELQGVYLISRCPEGLVIVDIHAAHERIIYERLKKSCDAGSIEVQMLIEPEEIELSPLGLDAVAHRRAELADAGFPTRSEDGVELLLGFPALLSGCAVEPAALAATAVEELAESGMLTAATEARDCFLASVACRAAMKGGAQVLCPKDLNSLLRQIESTDRSGRCNHGRPVWRVLEMAEIDRFFERGS